MNDSILSRTKRCIFSDDGSLPFTLSQYVQDVSMVTPDEFVFVGREPNGGSQYALKANIASSQVETIRRIEISPEFPSWMPNAGELACSKDRNRLAFAYRLHPVIDIFDMDGKLIKQVRIGSATFNPATLDEADFEDLNPLHTVDIAATPEYIYALYWNYKYEDADKIAPTLFKIDWDGNVIDRRPNLPMPIYKIAVAADKSIIGWTGTGFLRLSRHVNGCDK